ncbi:MAG: fatty acid desaturase [Sphingomonadaceae bacterium]|nr:fatty acid desaturase [Sphingomonadaceae bacterium]
MVAAWGAIHVGGIFAFPLSARTAPVAAALVLAQTWLSTGLFIIAHDCMHGAFASGRPGVNRAVGRVMLMLYAGLDYDRMLPNHFAHHRHTGTAEDPDFHAGAPTRPVPWLARFFANYYSHWQIVRIVAVLAVYQYVLGATLPNVLVFYAAPALLALVQLFYFGTFLPHRHGEAFPDRHRARSTNFGPLASVVTCFNFGGYHHEHHLHPHVPWWRLPAMRGRVAA